MKQNPTAPPPHRAADTEWSTDPVEPSAIRARGIRVHNLKNVDVDIPRGKLVAVCGVSGSGKTSLALDTLYAEGQRRYIESFSAYTRQYLERLEKPDFDSIDGLPPALAVTRGNAPRGNRSTVGTASETLDYLRLLYANVAQLICYQCGQPVHAYSPQSVARRIEALPPARLMLGFTVAWDDIADRAAVLAELQHQGFVRLLGGQRMLNLGADERQQLAESLPAQGSAIVIVDRLKGGDAPERTTESLETAFEHGYGRVELYLSGDPAEWQQHADLLGSVEPRTIDRAAWSLASFTRQRHCPRCGIDFQDPQPRLFSFNSPLGACSLCEGFGDTIDLDWNLIVPDASKTIAEGAIAPWNSPSYAHNLDELLDDADELGIPVDVPFRELTAQQRRVLMEGDRRVGYQGIQGFFGWLDRKKYKMHVRVFISRWRSYNRCRACGGARLSPEALSYKIGGYNLAELCDKSIEQLDELLSDLQFSQREQTIAGGPLRQVRDRLHYLQSVGLGYLQLSRPLRTLSGGEAQRTALTAALGSNLVNMLYVLDEPSVGLHPHDVDQLTDAITRLVDRGNTVLVVEHEEALLRKADKLIEVGPAAGNQGGEIVYSGPAKWKKKSKRDNAPVCLTMDFLSGRRRVPIPATRRSWKYSLRIRGCTGNNLKSLDAEFPLGVLCVVSGVSGSGKSSLVQDTLYAALANRLSETRSATLPFESITGLGQIDDCILVDQSPVSRSPRSNPVTYVKAFDEIRNAFAETVDAKMRNLTPGHFSFNSDLGRCPQCQGDGELQIDMQFLADVHMICPTCNGDRYRSEILAIKYRDRNIAEVLRMTVHDAVHFFRGAGKVQQKLKALIDVGLGYLQLGQPATTLSSGESQRLKLAGYLASASRKRTLFLLDEPTTGLHPQDIIKLLSCFDALLEAGHSLVVVEHNIHLIAAADHVIDLGPGAGQLGGQIVVAGTPETVAACDASLTAPYLRELP
jgi:excinuclease ABC subunit A